MIDKCYRCDQEINGPVESIAGTAKAVAHADIALCLSYQRIRRKDLHFASVFDSLAAAAHDNAVRKGFWGGVDLKELASMTDAAVKALAVKAALIHTEVSEFVEATRKRQDPALTRAEVGEELADIIIRVADTAGALGLSLGQHIATKMAKNLERPPLHGKVY